ncbi:DUF4825 domain-containing protein [Paenibacillus sp. CMAA1364]
MKNRNFIIVGLLLLGIIISVLVYGVINPRLAKNEEQYAQDQQDPLTHDVTSILKYRNKYMGNATNNIHLMGSLPLANIDRTFQQFPDTFTFEVHFKENILAIDKGHLEKSLIYNASAAFSLIDNLDEIHFIFMEDSYSVTRSAVAQWYNVDLSTLTDEHTWKQLVQSKLSDESYVADAMRTVFQ